MKPINNTHFYFIFFAIIVGAFFYSSKGILIKMMYGEGLDANAVLVLRMGVAFPFYVVSVLMMRRSLTGISFKDWIAMLILGLIGSAIVQKESRLGF